MPRWGVPTLGNASMIRSHVPSASQRLNRVWMLFQFPYRSGSSRHAQRVRAL